MDDNQAFFYRVEEKDCPFFVIFVVASVLSVYV